MFASRSSSEDKDFVSVKGEALRAQSLASSAAPFSGVEERSAARSSELSAIDEMTAKYNALAYQYSVLSVKSQEMKLQLDSKEVIPPFPPPFLSSLCEGGRNLLHRRASDSCGGCWARAAGSADPR